LGDRIHVSCQNNDTNDNCQKNPVQFAHCHHHIKLAVVNRVIFNDAIGPESNIGKTDLTNSTNAAAISKACAVAPYP
jgi:hypothetical protein